MTGLRAWLAGLAPAVRWSLLGVILVLLGVVLASGLWTWQGRREAEAQQALAPILASARQALTSGGERAALDGVAESLDRFLKGHPRSRVTAQAWYLLGQVEYQRRRWEAAQAAFTEAIARDSGTLGALSRLGLGYTHEARGDFARALDAYQQALVGRQPRDFLYGDLVLAKARAQEQVKDVLGAVETYRRFLKDEPTSPRVEEVRIRLALLGASS